MKRIKPEEYIELLDKLPDGFKEDLTDVKKYMKEKDISKVSIYDNDYEIRIKKKNGMAWIKGLGLFSSLLCLFVGGLNIYRAFYTYREQGWAVRGIAIWFGVILIFLSIRNIRSFINMKD